MASEEKQPFDPTSFEHIPVLLNECLEGLAIDPAGTYLLKNVTIPGQILLLLYRDYFP